MARFHNFNLSRLALIALASISLSGCEVGSSTKAKVPYRAPSAGNSGVSNANSAEVGSSLSVAVTVKDRAGFGIPNVVPTITAVDSTGSSTGITSGGCGVSNAKGVAICTVRSTLPKVYTVKVITPVASTGNAIKFYQLPRSLAFTTSPSCLNVTVTSGTNCVAASVITTQPVVEVRDAVGNPVITSNDNTKTTEGGSAITFGNVTMSLTTPGTATLSGTLIEQPVSSSGVADFAGNGLKVNLIGTGTYTLTASYSDPSAGVLTAVSSSFPMIAGAPSKLVFTTSPGPTSPATSIPANTIFGVQPVVAVEDANGNVITNDSTCVVTLSMTTAVGAADVLLGTLAKTVSAGVANFDGSNSRINTIVSGARTLTATASGAVGTTCGAGGITAAVSSSFTISLSGLPSQLAITQAPGASPINKVWDVQPIVKVLDSNGDLVSGDNTTVVVMSIVTGSGTLVGTTSLRVTQGTAAFSGVKTTGTVAVAGTPDVYTLKFSGVNPGAPAISFVTTSQIINDNGATPTKLSFSIQPTNVAKNQSMSTAIVVETQDANGFFCFNDQTTSVTLSILSGPGTMSQNGISKPAGVVDVVLNGQATFPAISFSAAGAYVLQATAAGKTTGTSSTFAIAAFGTANHLHFAVQPADSAVVNGTKVWTTQPQVEVMDAFNNRVTSDNSTVVVLDCVSPIVSPACSISGTITKTVVNGLADFTGANLTTSNTAAAQSNVAIRAQTSPSGTLLQDQSLSFNETL